MSLVNRMLFHALYLFLMAGGLAGVIAGVALLLRPGWLLHANSKGSHWVSTRQINLLLEQAIKVDRWFYRHHRISGALLLAGAGFLIYFFTAHFDRSGTLRGLSRIFLASPVTTGLMLDAVVLSILLGSAFTLIISVFLLLRPSMLRGFEQGANQWLSLRRAIKPLESNRSGMDDYIFRNVQLSGALLLLGSLYCMTVVTISMG
jgi:hypothetical protein